MLSWVPHLCAKIIRIEKTKKAGSVNITDVDYERILFCVATN